MKSQILKGALIAAALPAMAIGQTIATTTPTNGSGGIFLELMPTMMPLSVTSFATYFSSASGTPVSVDVWTRPGSYAGFTASSAGWVLSETVVATSAGRDVLSGHTVLANPISIPSGGPTPPTSIYLHAVTSGGGIRYTGTGAAPPQTMWANADVTLFSDISRTGSASFGGTAFTPRTFAGEINYRVIPAPGAMALLGLGGLLATRRRR